MAKAELKTKANDGSVSDFLDSIADERKREDSYRLLEIFGKATGSEPKMWGRAIIGFGERRLKYDSGRELDWMIVGFSPRKANLTLYGLLGSLEQDGLLEKIGKCSTGKGCLYFKTLADVDESVLEKLIKRSVVKAKKG
ncbi:MAG: DUF1801 domain-containing protein [Acidobacteriota bacterium]